MKRRLITAVICLLVASVPAILMLIGISRRGLLPDSLERYSDSVTVRTPSGDEFTYKSDRAEFAVIRDTVLTASLSTKERASTAAYKYHRFDLILDGRDSITLSAYISYAEPCGFLATSGEKYYEIAREPLYKFLKSSFASCLWVSEDPPSVTLEGVALKPSVVSWSYILPNGDTVNSDEYLSKAPTEYSIASHRYITPTFSVTPTSVFVVALEYGGDTRYFEGSASDFVATSLPTDRKISVIYTVEWQCGDRGHVRAAYGLVIPPAAAQN